MAKKKAEEISVADLDNVTDDEIFASHEGVETDPPEEPVVEPKVEVIVEPTPPAPVIVEPAKPAVDQDAMARMAYELRELKRQNEELKAPKPAPVEVPDPETDPIGHMRWQMDELRKENEGFKKWQADTVQETAAEKQTRQVNNTLQSAENEFSAKTADYNDVSQYVIKEMFGSAKKLAPLATDQQLFEYVQGQIREIGVDALNKGKNPAESLYTLGKTVYGYQPPQAEQPRPTGKPSLEVVDKNMRRSGNGLGSGSGKKNLPSAEEFSKLSINAMNKFTPEEQGEIMGEQVS